MSKEQAYYPPNGTSLEWRPKVLTNRPWGCNISDQLAKDLGYIWPLYIVAWVDFDSVNNKYKWRVEICDWNFNLTTKKGTAKTAIRACLNAENIGKIKFKQLTPDWVLLALKHGWRPPCNM